MSGEQKAPAHAPAYAYDGLDRVFHERARLGIVTSLSAHPKGLAFGDLKTLCGLTDGNLSRHLKVLEAAGFVEIEKGYDRNRPLTRCRLSREGRDRFGEYLAVLERVVRDAAEVVGDEPMPSTMLKPKPG